MNFPDWAPEDLCASYREDKVYWDMPKTPDDKGISITDSQKALLERLLTHPDMKRAWRELKKRKPEWMEELLGTDVFLTVDHALHEANREPESRKEKAYRFRVIARATRNCARAVEGSELDRSPDFFNPREAIGANLKHFRSKLGEDRSDLTEALDRALDEIGDKDNIWNGAYPHPLTAKDAREGTIELQDEFKHIMLTVCYPSFSWFAYKIAERADAIAKEAITEDRVLPYPKSKNARRDCFIRLLGRFFRSHWGSYLYGTLAAFARVALEEKGIGPQEVRTALRRNPGEFRPQQ
jgi:hypothetical protein